MKQIAARLFLCLLALVPGIIVYKGVQDFFNDEWTYTALTYIAAVAVTVVALGLAAWAVIILVLWLLREGFRELWRLANPS